MNTRQPSLTRSAISVIATVVIFAVVGPLVGALVFWSLGSLLSGHGMRGGLGLFAFTVLIALPAPYIVGGPAAALTGVIVAVTSKWLAGPSALYSIAAFTGAILGVVMFYGVLPLSRASVARQGPTIFAVQHAHDIVLLVVAGAIAAICCTRLTRRFRLSRPEGY